MLNRLIDLFLVAAGIALAALVAPLAGAPLVVLGIVMPVIRVAGGRGTNLALVPPDVADRHRAVARVGTPDAIADADRIVAELAAVLRGREPRGASQRRLVDERARDLDDIAAAMVAARRELDAMDAADAGPTGGERGALVVAAVFVLYPAFFAWEVVISTWFGVALRMRLAGALVARALRWVLHLRADIAGASREARRRFVLRGRAGTRAGAG